MSKSSISPGFLSGLIDKGTEVLGIGRVRTCMKMADLTLHLVDYSSELSCAYVASGPTRFCLEKFVVQPESRVREALFE